jgi:hypothetical protein
LDNHPTLDVSLCSLQTSRSRLDRRRRPTNLNLLLPHPSLLQIDPNYVHLSIAALDPP